MINELPDGQCEFSFDYYLKSNKNFTRYDEIIDFDSDWNLGFWNEGRFAGMYQWIEGNQIRERNPFEVTWRGYILIPHDPEARLSIEYTGEGKIQLGKSIVSLPTKYQSKNTLLINIFEILSEDLTEKNDNLVLPIQIHYKFQDFSKVGMDISTLGPHSNISVKLVTNEGISHLKSYYVRDIKLKSLSILLDSIIALIILAIIVSHLTLIHKEGKFLFIAYLLFGVIILFLSQSQALNFINSASRTRIFLFAVVPSSIFFFVVISIDYFARREKGVLYFFISFLFITQLFIHLSADLKMVDYKTPGDDTITFESQSRSIGKAKIINEFLRGGSDVFYYQPFFRYYLAFNHILFGDGTNSLSIFNKFLFLLTIPFIFLFFSQRLDFIPALAFSLASMWIFYNWIFPIIYFGLSEYPAWLFLILAVYLLFSNRSRSGYIIGFVLLGFASITRINFLPGILYLIFVFYISYLFNNHRHKERKKRYGFIFISFLIFVGIYSLVPLHNYYFGNKWILTTSSAAVSANLELQPSKLLHIFSDENIRQHVLRALKLIFYLDRSNLYYASIFDYHSLNMLQKSRFFFNLFLYLLSISFLYNIGRLGKIIINPAQRTLVKKETIMNLLFILVPISFLFVHLFYQVKVYYPRHIVMGHIMIFLFSIYCSSSLINWCYEKFEKLLFALTGKTP